MDRAFFKHFDRFSDFRFSFHSSAKLYFFRRRNNDLIWSLSAIWSLSFFTSWACFLNLFLMNRLADSHFRLSCDLFHFRSFYTKYENESSFYKISITSHAQINSTPVFLAVISATLTTLQNSAIRKTLWFSYCFNFFPLPWCK